MGMAVDVLDAGAFDEPNSLLLLPRSWPIVMVVANARTATLCQKVKDENIVVYTVSFMVTNAVAIDLLRNCASDPSKAFVADNAAALSAAFGNIANSLMAFRLTR